MSLTSSLIQDAGATNSLSQLDPRTTEDIYRQALQLARRYCPDWYNIQAQDIDEQDLGVVLLKLFSQLSHTLVYRLNQLPQKQLLSFYQFMGLDLQPPIPAQALLSFELNSTVDDVIAIPVGTQVASSKDQKIIFETTSQLNATRIPINTACTLIPNEDSFQDISTTVLGKSQPFTLFPAPDTSANQTSSTTYLTHEMFLASDLLQYNTPATVTLTLTFTDPLSPKLHESTLWEWFVYDSKGNETRLYPAQLKDAAGNPQANPVWQNNQLIVTFDSVLFAANTLDQYTGYWLGIRFLPPPDLASLKQPVSSVVGGFGAFPPRQLVGAENVVTSKLATMSFDLSADNVPWDALFVNDSQVNANKGFYLFGKNPEVNDTFYLGSSEAFKSGFVVTLDMDFNPGVKSPDLQLACEYWDGIQWQLVDVSHSFTQRTGSNQTWTPVTTLDFTAPKQQSTSTQDTEITMSLRFTCPDIAMSKINEVDSRWIRIKIVAGNYGDRYHLTPLDLSQQKKLQQAIDETVETLSKNWPDDVLPDKSKFQLAELMRLGHFAPQEQNLIHELFSGVLGGLVSIISGGLIESILDLLSKSSVSDLFKFDKEVTVKGQKNIIHYAGLDQIQPTLEENMKKYLGETLNWKSLMDYLNKEGWVIGSKKNCVPPYMIALRLNYSRSNASFQRISVTNNFATNSLTTDNGTFAPFYPFYLVMGMPAFYLGFTGAATQQLWNAWFSFEQPSPATQALNNKDFTVIFEYLSQQGWVYLPIETNETNNFSQSGVIAWQLPTDASFKALFNSTQPSYWVRFRLQQASNNTLSTLLTTSTPSSKLTDKTTNKKTNKTTDTTPVPAYSYIQVKGIYPNSVWASDYTSHYNQVIGTSNENANQQFQITPYLVYPGQQIEVKEATYPNPEQTRIIELESGPDAIRTINTPTGKEIWIRWAAVSNLTLSGPKSRHYTIDHETGTITFGNGVQGMVPPGLKNNIMAAFYRRGNSTTDLANIGELSKLVNQLDDVKGVTNNEAAIGKKQRESQQQFLQRIPESLKTRDRATALQDFQFLTVQASNLVAQAKSYQDTQDPNTIHVIIVPNSDYGSRYPGSELSDSVSQYLLERALPTLNQSIHIVAPNYVAINVSANIVITSGYTQTAVRSALNSRLTRFFDPVLGQSKGQGWPFGAVIFSSQVSAEIQNEPGVERIVALQVTAPAPVLSLPSQGEGTASLATTPDTQEHNRATQASTPTNAVNALFGQIPLSDRSLPLPGLFSIQITTAEQWEASL